VVRVKGKAGCALPQKVKVESWSMLEGEVGWRYKIGEAEVGLMRSEVDLGTAVSGVVMFSEQAEDVISGWITILPGQLGGFAGFRIGSEFLLLSEEAEVSGDLLIGHKGQGPFKKPVDAPEEWVGVFSLYLPTAAGGKMTIKCSDKRAKMGIIYPEGPGPFWAKHRKRVKKIVGNKYEEAFYGKQRHGLWWVVVWSKAEQYTMDVEFVQESNEAKNPETREVPWTGNWWPTFPGLNWNPWMDNGPFDKLDKLIMKVTGYKKFHLDNLRRATTFRKWLEKNVKQEVDRSYGHCHVFSYMSSYKREPYHTLTRANVSFGPGDLKGLLIVGSSWEPPLPANPAFREPWLANYANPVVGHPFGEAKEPDPKCWGFHRALRDTVIVGARGKKKEPTPLVIDRDNGPGGWNSPIYKVRFYFLQNDRFTLFKVLVSATIWYTDYESENYDRIGPKPSTTSYKYVLAYDDSGRIQTGKKALLWDSKWQGNNYPDFVWTRNRHEPTLNWLKMSERGKQWRQHERIPFYKIADMLLSPDKTIIYGQVVDQAGNPVREPVVSVIPLMGGFYKRAYIGKDGRFAFFEAWPARWLIYVTAPGYKQHWLLVNIPTPPKGEPVGDTDPLKIVLERE